MIVKNSGDILKDCIQQNKYYVDYFTIVDTGSTDNTINIIQDELKDIKGKLHFVDFKDFSQARNEALKLSSKTCKYTIILDDSYIINGGYKLREILMKSNEKCYKILIGHLHNGYLQDKYYSTRIIKTDENLKYKYKVHEKIDIENELISELEHDIFIDDIETREHIERSFRRYRKDIQLLLEDLNENPNDPRITYYLAKTYYNLEDYTNSLKYFKLLKEVCGEDEEYLFSSDYEST